MNLDRRPDTIDRRSLADQESRSDDLLLDVGEAKRNPREPAERRPESRSDGRRPLQDFPIKLRTEFHITTYDSIPTDLAEELRGWPEFVDGRGYSVLLGSGGDEARVWKVEDPGGFPTVVCSGMSRSSLLDKVIGRVIQALEEHSDNLMVDGPFDPSREPYDYSELSTFEIDGDNIGSLEEFWDEISEKLIPNVNWGRNLDAFRDILKRGFGLPEEFELVWNNSELSKERLSYEETVRQLEIRRRQCHPAAIEGTDFRLELARAGKGFTVFDWLVDIVRESPGVKLTLL